MPQDERADAKVSKNVIYCCTPTATSSLQFCATLYADVQIKTIFFGSNNCYMKEMLPVNHS